MSLKIMIAGCAKDERDEIESSVKSAFGGRAENDPWNVSLVNIANQWSIEIDGPEPRFKGLSFVAVAEDLAASVRRALNAASAADAGEGTASPQASETPAPPATTATPAVAGAATAAAAPTLATAAATSVTPATAKATPTTSPVHTVDGDKTDRHQCEGCAAPFDVFYYAVAGERMESCPVACPSCWHVNNVPIAAGAGLNGDYRAQAAG